MSISAYVVINTHAIQHNLAIVRHYAPPCKIMAVIKANAYGHGLLTIAKALQNIDALAVARTSEGIQLRQVGCTQRIIVLGGFMDEQELHDLIQYNLETVVHLKNQVASLERQQDKHKNKDQNKDQNTIAHTKNTPSHKVTVWLKLDTGMNRLGFKADEFVVMYERIMQCTCVNKPLGLMTHCANADNYANHTNPEDSDTTLKQIALFKATTNHLAGEKSIANSAAIMAYPDSLADWVRPGLMLYGVSPFADDRQLNLKPVMSLHSKLIAIKHINAGEAVGYGGRWVSQKRTTLGIVAIGYGDGYPRQARNGTPILVKGQRVSLVGWVSMDMLTVDLGALQNVKVGDAVTLWGQGLLVEEVAKWADTIPYTLLCGITARVNRQTI